MRTLSILCVLVCLMSFEVAAAAQSSQPAAEAAPTGLYPASAHLCAWADRANLQRDMDTYGATVGVRLEPGKDYNRASGGPPSLTVSSNMRLYAINSRICHINIPAGSSDIFLGGLTEGIITFLAGTPEQVTRRITFNRINYITLAGTGCRIDGFTWYDAYNTNVRLNCSQSGFVRNFRVINSGNQNDTQPFALMGNAAEPSYGNIIVIGNYLNGDSPEGPRVLMQNVREWLSMQIGAESYWGPRFPWFSPRGVRSVRAFGMGGLVDNDSVWETDSPDVLLVADQMATFRRGQADGSGGQSQAPTHHFLPGADAVVSIAAPFGPQAWNAQRSYHRHEQAYRNGKGYRSMADKNIGHDPATDTTNWQIQKWIGFDDQDDVAAPTLRATFFDDGGTNAKPIRVNGVQAPTTLAAEVKARIRATVAAPPTGLVPWNPPGYATPPSDFSALPAGTLTRAQIQAQLDTGSGVCMLPPGIYRLDGPLLLGTRADGVRRVLVGAGKDRTVLLARDATTDVINEANDGPGSSSIDMLALTLKGGRWGVNLFSKKVAGKWVQRQYTGCIVSDVCIRDMSAGGWHIENMYGMDNNGFQGMDFVNCPIGWQQTGGNDPNNNTWAYMDKNMWAGCQWLDCGVALDLHPSRNSGANVFLESRFQGNTSKLLWANHNPLYFINCDIIDNGGDPVIYNYGSTFFVSCRVHDSGSALSLYDGHAPIFEGCMITRSGSSTFKVGATSSEAAISRQHIGLQDAYNARCTHFLNSYVGVPIGQWYNGAAINTCFADPSDAFRAGAIVYAHADRPDGAGAPVPAKNLRYQVLDATRPFPQPGVLLCANPYPSLASLPADLPQVTSPNTLTTVCGSPVRFAVTATYAPTAFAARPLPPGLRIDSRTGILSGSPELPGVWLCAVTAANSAGQQAAWLTITVTTAPANATDAPVASPNSEGI